MNIIFNFNTNYYHRINNNNIIEEKIQHLAFILIILIDNHLDRIYIDNFNLNELIKQM